MNRYIPQSQVDSTEVYFFVKPQGPEFLIINLRGGQMNYLATSNLAEATTFNNYEDMEKQLRAMSANKPEILNIFQGTRLTKDEFLKRTGNQQPRKL